MITVREETREETLILDDGLMIQETLERLAAKDFQPTGGGLLLCAFAPLP